MIVYLFGRKHLIGAIAVSDFKDISMDLFEIKYY